MKGKARGLPHARISDEERSRKAPLVGLDFCYMKSDAVPQDTAEGAWATTLIGVDQQTQRTLAVTMDDKGASNTYAHDCVVHWIDAILMLRQVRVRTDNEPAIKSLVAYVQMKRDHDTIAEPTPRYSSGSNGVCDVGMQILQGQMRTLRSQLEADYAVTLTPAHVIWPWLVRHSSWLHDRFAIKANGQTPYQMHNGCAYTAEICPFGETILWRFSFPEL